MQGERLLSAVVSQGLPTIPTFLLADVGEKNLKKLNEVKKSLLKNIEKKFPDLELVIAWNQPMLKSGDGYVIGVMLTKGHMSIHYVLALGLQWTWLSVASCIVWILVRGHKC